jgi:hypothetical protein
VGVQPENVLLHLSLFWSITDGYYQVKKKKIEIVFINIKNSLKIVKKLLTAQDKRH